MVNGKLKAGFAVELLSGSHTLLSDVPTDLGGTDLGINPHRLFEASLVSCTIMTLKMYADRQKWPLTQCDVKVTIDKEGPESHLNREISLGTELTADQRKKLMEIADRCPIHKLMSSKITITTTQKD